LARAIEALRDAEYELEAGNERVEIVAEHVRTAILAVDGLVGRIGVEMLLGEIFASFCIGK
jgi:tRNA modification GTPase